jgi:hypothetical protein
MPDFLERILEFFRRTLLWIAVILASVFLTLVLLSPQVVGEQIETIRPAFRLIVVIILNGALLLYFYFRIRQPRGSSETGLTVRTAGAITEVSVESTRERVLRAVSSLPDILSVNAEVLSVRGHADITLDVVVARDEINVPEKQKEIDRALRQVINKQLGLQMASQPRIRIEFQSAKKPVVPVEPKLDTLPEPPQPAPEIESKAEVEEEKPHAGIFGGLFQKADDEKVDEKPELPEVEPQPDTPVEVSEVSPIEETTPQTSDGDEDDSWVKFASELQSLEDKKPDEKADETPSEKTDNE